MTLSVVSNLGNLVSGGLPWWLAVLSPIAAAVVAYELITAATGRTSLRLPLLILKCARLGMSAEDWEYEGPEYEAETRFCLEDRRHGRVARFVQAMSFTIPLALGGLRRVVKASKRTTARAKRGEVGDDPRAQAEYMRAVQKARARSVRVARAGFAGGLGSLAAAGASSAAGQSMPWMLYLAMVGGTVLAAMAVVLLRRVTRGRRRDDSKAGDGG